MAERLTRIQTDIDRYDWHVILVPEDEIGPSFAYSIGLYQTFRHPEVIVFGLDLANLHSAVNQIGSEIRKGVRFGEGDGSDEVFEGVSVRFRLVSTDFYDEYLGQAIRYYAGNGFPCLQCFWPDGEGSFPWDSDYRFNVDSPQPQLQQQK